MRHLIPCSFGRRRSAGRISRNCLREGSGRLNEISVPQSRVGDWQEKMESSSGRFPYVCSLRKRGSHAHVCGAALFRRGWVLAAAHCVDPRVSGSVGLTPIVDCGTHGLTDGEQDKVSSIRQTTRDGRHRRRCLTRWRDTCIRRGLAMSPTDMTWQS